MAACMSHLLTHPPRALQFYHCEQPVRAPCTTVAKHSRSRDHMREQKQPQTELRTTGGSQLQIFYSFLITVQQQQDERVRGEIQSATAKVIFKGNTTNSLQYICLYY